MGRRVLRPDHLEYGSEIPTDSLRTPLNGPDGQSRNRLLHLMQIISGVL
jgi:hypothetical protein